MESRANYAAIGLFVLVILLAGLGFLYWLTNAGEQARQAMVRVVFGGAVTGLNTGSGVLFNGIKVGEVRDLTLDEQDPNTVVALISVNRNIPVRTDTRAVLSYQGLTGASQLQLEGGSRNAPLLFDAVTEGIPTIQAEISPFQDILESARNVLTRADSAMAAIDDFVNENGPAFNRTVNNVEVFSRALADNSDGIAAALQSLQTASVAIGDLSTSLKGSVARAETLLNAIEPDQVSSFVADLNASADRLERVMARAETIAEGIDPAQINAMVASLRDTAGTLQGTIQRADAVFAAIDPADVEQLIGNLDRTAVDIAAAARRAEAVMAAVDGTAVSRIVSNADNTMTALAEASDSVGGVVTSAREALNRVGEVVGAVDPDKVRGAVDGVASFAAGLDGYRLQIDRVMADVQAASGSLRRLGETIDGRTGDVDATIGDARALVGQLNGIADRTAAILESVNGYVEGDGQGFVSEATAAATSIREAADTLNRAIGPITSDVARFTDRGLSSFTDLANQGQRALSRLERVLGGIETNPQQFIFGGDGVPEYAPRRR